MCALRAFTGVHQVAERACLLCGQLSVTPEALTFPDNIRWIFSTHSKPPDLSLLRCAGSDMLLHAYICFSLPVYYVSICSSVPHIRT